MVLGDPGPVRDELLLRAEVDVIWSACHEDTLELIKNYTIDACIVAAKFQSLLGKDEFREAIKIIPVMVWHRDAYDVDTVLGFLARSTGLIFARYPRVALKLPVTLGVHGDQYHLETDNLSVSGVAISHFPNLAAGTRVELCLELPSRPIYLLARVARVYEGPAGRQGGLTFTDLGEGLRAALTQVVDERLSESQDLPSFIGDQFISMPLLRQVVDQESREWMQQNGSLATPSLSISYDGLTMRTISDGKSASCELLPDWFEHLQGELSDPERLAACGGDAPHWAHRVLQLRISLARARSRTPTNDVPPTLIDEAYRMFAGIEQETMDAPFEVREQVSSIRASLLKDVLGEHM